MKRTKQFLSLFLALAILFTMLPTAGFAVETEPAEDITIEEYTDVLNEEAVSEAQIGTTEEEVIIDGETPEQAEEAPVLAVTEERLESSSDDSVYVTPDDYVNQDCIKAEEIDPESDAIVDHNTLERSVESSFPTRALSAVANGFVPNDCLKYGGHSYFVYPEGVVSTWAEAIEYCRNLGGHIATIGSEQENQAIYSYICERGYYSAYFGFSDEASEGVWRWVTSENITYTNWHNGEPNAESSREDYAMFYWKFTNGQWNDGAFDTGSTNGDTNAFICEWDYDVDAGEQKKHFFEIGVDTNSQSFIHSNSSFFYGSFLDSALVSKEKKRDNRYAVTDSNKQTYYVVDEKSEPALFTYPLYVQHYVALLRGEPDYVKSEVAKNMRKAWGGSCYGMAATMALASQGIIGSESGIESDFYDTDLPKDNHLFRSTINMFQLSQNTSKGKETKKLFNNFFMNLINKDSSKLSKHDFLEMLVEEAQKSQSQRRPFVLTFGYSGSGHALVAYGISQQDGSTYSIPLYDPNGCYKSSMRINLNDNTFTFREGNPHGKPGDKNYQEHAEINEQNYTYLAFLGIDQLFGSMANMVSSIENDGVRRTASEGDITNEELHQILTVSMSKKCRITSNYGKTIVFDGEQYSGTMEVYDVDVVGEGENTQLRLYVEPYDSISVEDIGDSFEISGETEGGYYSVWTDGADSLHVNGNSIEIAGDQYSFETITPKGTEATSLLSASGVAYGNTSIQASADTLSVESEKYIENVVISTYSEVDQKKDELEQPVSKVEVSHGDSTESEVDYVTATVDISLAEVKLNTAYAYTGKPVVPDMVIKSGDTMLKKDVDYTLSCVNNTNAGTAKVTITGKGDYTGTITKTFQIKKAKQTLTFTPASVVKGKTATLKVKGSFGRLTYATSNKKVATVTTTGVVKGVQTGTVTITVKAAGDKNHESVTQKVKFTVYACATPKVSKVENVNGGVKLTWGKVAGAAKYRVFYKTGKGKWTKLADTTSTSYTWKKAKNGTTYAFTVRCISKDGKAYTSGYNTTGKSLTYVATPTLSSVKNSKAKAMTASWKKLSGVTGFQIQYSTNKSFKSGNKTVTVKKAAAVSQEISGPTKGKTYYVRIRSYKTVSGKNVYSAWSGAKSVKISK